MDSNPVTFATDLIDGRVAGDRTATFMFYLNTVEAGGSTAFPVIGKRVQAQRNTAVFWYNLLPDGTPDNRTLHAACPVLLGQKWVTNRWFHDYGQVFTRPCPSSYVMNK